MIRRTFPTALVFGFGLFGLACKEETPSIAAKDYPVEMADGYCSAVFSCACEDPPYVNFNECRAELFVAYDELNDAAFVANLTYDGTCPAAELQDIDALACKAWLPALPAGVCQPPCNAWHGPFPAGSQCDVVASSPELGIGFSTCAQGLTCLAGVCVNPCQLVDDVPGLGEACPDLVCDVGGMCDPVSQICVAVPALPGPGAACESGLCNPLTAVCVVEANVCAALPGVGQQCIQGLCNPDGYCGVDNVCLARPALACGLLGPGVPGDGDGDPTGDGDGDGDPTGDGDGDPTGDGDGDPGSCSPIPLPSEVPTGAVGSTLSATAIETGSCGGGGPEQAHSFVAPVAGLYLMSLAGSDFDTVMYVRDGACSGAELACDDDSVDGTWSELEVSLSAGQEVVIFVDGYSGSGNFQLTIDLL